MLRRNKWGVGVRRMAQVVALPVQLAQRAEELRADDVLSQRIEYRPEAWHHWIDEPRAVDVIDAYSGSITRADLADLADPALAKRGPDDLLRLFVGCQLWGAGTGDNRGPWRTSQALATDGVAEVLVRLADQVGNGDLGPTYGSQLRMWGPSFVTKFTYALALAVDRAAPRALILDQLVWASLTALGWDSRAAAGSRRWADRYVAYLDTMHSWARELDCRPDAVEKFLFDRAGDFDAPSRS